MTTVTVKLPDDLAEELRGEGLLEPDAAEVLGALMRDGLRRRRTESAVSAREQVAASESEGRAGAAGGWLAEALRELDGMDEEIKEEDLPPISNDMRTDARRLLVALGEQPVAPMVCPTEYGEISLYFKAPDTRGAIHIVLDGKGEAAWYCVIPGRKGYGRHKNPAELPIDFLLTRLKTLAPAPSNA